MADKISNFKYLPYVCKLASQKQNEQAEVRNLKKKEVKRMDELVKDLGLDVNRQTYFFQSRNGD